MRRQSDAEIMAALFGIAQLGVLSLDEDDAGLRYGPSDGRPLHTPGNPAANAGIGWGL